MEYLSVGASNGRSGMYVDLGKMILDTINDTAYYNPGDRTMQNNCHRKCSFGR